MSAAVVTRGRSQSSGLRAGPSRAGGGPGSPRAPAWDPVRRSCLQVSVTGVTVDRAHIFGGKPQDARSWPRTATKRNRTAVFFSFFSRHFLICMFTEPRPCSETCASSLPAGVGSAARGRPSPAVGLAGARRLHLSGARRLHLSREALCCRLRGRHSCFSSGSLSLRSERVHAWRCFAFLANAKDSEEGLARLASLHDVPKRRPQIQGGTLAMS